MTTIAALSKMINELTPDVPVLRCDHVTATPIDVDWSEIDIDNTTFTEAVECDGCKQLVVLTGYVSGEQHRHAQEECARCDGDGEVEEERIVGSPQGYVECPDCDGRGRVNCRNELYAEGPQMNYFYPCRWSDAAEAAKAIKHLPLVVVEHEEHGKGLALTGGGMDLSWEICAAYVALGFLPPAHFRDLPKIAGHYRQGVVDAMKRTLMIQAAWAISAAARLDEKGGF